MTSAEAIRELRLLVTAARRAGMARHDLRYMAATAAEVARHGIDPVIELRIRRFRRLVRTGA